MNYNTYTGFQYSNKQLNRGQLFWPAACERWSMPVDFSWCSNLNRSDYFIKNPLYVAQHTKKLWAFSDLLAAISAALHETFVHSKYANSASQFL